MNNCDKIPDEQLTENDILRLERELLIVTDSHRTPTQVESLSPTAQVQVQTFDQLTSLLEQINPLKPVQWSVSTGHKTISHKKSLWYTFKRITTVVLSLGILTTIVLCNQWVFVVQKGTQESTFTQNTQADSNGNPDDSLCVYNYWDNSFENQLSDFEGEMVCMSVASNNVMLMDSTDYLDDFSDLGDF